MVGIDYTNPNTSWHYSSVISLSWYLNSLAPGKFEWNFRHLIFKQILVTDGWGISCEIAMIWMSLDFTDDQSTLVPVMAWCRQAPSHYLSQCWPRSWSPYGITRPQWVNALATWLFFQQTVQADKKQNITDLYYWPLVASLHKGPAMWKAFTCCDVIMRWIISWPPWPCCFMTSSNGNIYHVIVPLCGESSGYQWISPHKVTIMWHFDVSVLFVWTNCRTNTPLTGNLRHRDGHLTSP